jgi:hypothetical protein
MTTATLTVEVTAEDIANAGTGCFLCPIATALERTTAPRWCVEHLWCRRLFAERRQIALPLEATTFIVRFDKGRPVAPFTFTLNLEPALFAV